MYLRMKNCTCIYILLLVSVFSYETRCPDLLERSILSTQCSSEKPFHCLIDYNSKTFIQGCRKWEWVANGSFPLLSGSYIYYKDCIPDTYQPYTYKSNEGYKCSFAKSLCKESGHVTLSNGTTVTDRLCGCDHTRGYAFVNGLASGSCNPVVEDCSCYLKGCGLGQNLNYDFICGQVDNWKISMMERNTINVPLVNVHEDTISGNLKQKHAFLDEYRKYILTALVVISMIFSLANFSVTILYKNTNEETIMFVEYKQDSGLASLQSTNDQYNSTVARPQTAQTTKPQPAIEDKTSNTYTVQPQLTDNVQMSSSGNVKDSVDILILDLEHVPDKAKVIEFRDHLRSLVPELCYRDIQIRLFEEIYIHTASTKQIKLAELFNRCKYLFVYISKSYMPLKALQKGLSEKDLVSAMKTSKYRNIITVCDCEDWNYPDEYRTDLNYFNYKHSKDCEAYKSFLRRLLQTLP